MNIKIRESFLPIAVPDISDAEISEVIDALKSGWISVGPKVRELERIFAGIHKSKYALAVNSATSALFLVCKVMGIKPGNKVIIPSMTWPSTANVIEQLGAVPVFVDVERETANITPRIVEEKIIESNKDVQLIIPVHMSGLPVDIDGFSRLSEKYSIPILYDAAHAVFSEYRGEPVGKFGTASVFSFYAIKNITTGDGGIITTDNEKLLEEISLWAYHGMNKDAWKRYSKEQASPHVQSMVPGYKFNMTDLNAAVGIAQLRRFKPLRDYRNELVRSYNELFSGQDKIELPLFETGIQKWGNHVYGIRILDPGIKRDDFMLKLKEFNIGTNIHFYPVHQHMYYREKYPGVKLPVTEWLGERLISLPLCTKHKKEDLKYVADVINHILSSKEY